MTQPIDVKRVASLISADNELDGIERSLKRTGDRTAARKIAHVREILARALDDEQTGLRDVLANLR